MESPIRTIRVEGSELRPKADASKITFETIDNASLTESTKKVLAYEINSTELSVHKIMKRG
jgi:hypothetical protein